ncbi:11171_t:CDS:2 [Racocetra persica]|uniref:11171_t:CDS:1 n=1 Tax=Racocetra persica TaxID=160502 RepID=A0ACA9KJC9_9GLOM|nr:11171_t:CDS:2 [Racocetra persica]
MSDMTPNPNWFHSDLLKIFYEPNCHKYPVQSEGCLEEIEITPKHKKNTKQFKDSQKFKKLVNELLNDVTERNMTHSHYKLTTQNTTKSHHKTNTRLTTINFNDLNKKISIAEEKNNKSIYEVLKRYYDLGESIAQSYKTFYMISHDVYNSRQQVYQEFMQQLNIDTLDSAIRKRKEWGKKIYSLLSCFNTNDNGSRGKEMINRIRSFSLSTISNLSWDNINIVKEYITTRLNIINRHNNMTFNYYHYI